LYDAGRISPPIWSLPDEVLLHIFEFCLPDPVERRAKAWPKLVHVCQRWRYLIFASPLRLDLRLLCTERTPVRRTLDVWPPLPIEIRCFSLDPQAEDNIIAALEHPNRLRTISLRGIAIPLERLVAVTQEPFPAMETLDLRVKGTVPALPNTFLGGSAPRLRSLHLEGIPFPTLPRLLLTSNDLVDLAFDQIPHSGYISPETMVTWISALTSLTHLSIGFESPASRPDPTTRHSPPLKRAVLPALTSFYFHGVSEYLEDLMAQIDAPLLHWLLITFFNQLVFDIQRLIRFIGHAPVLTMPYDSAVIRIHDNYIQVIFRGRSQSFIHKTLSVTTFCRAVDWQVSSVAQICNQLSFILSSIDQLSIDNEGSIQQVDMDDTQWLELLQPFTAVQTLRILSDDIESLVVPALRGLSGELATQVLPALEELQLSWYPPSRRYNWPFLIARQHSDHPVVVGEFKW
jgi:F-box-like